MTNSTRGRVVTATDSALSGYLVPGEGEGPHPGVLILHGSGGPDGYERAYAERLARCGYTTFCVSYFDAPTAPDALQTVPLETFERAAAWLRERPTVSASRATESVAVVGFSRGAEAALLAGSEFDNLAPVVGYVSSAYSFPAPTWMDGVESECAAWTLDGEQLPYLPVEKYVPETQDGIEDAIGGDTPDATARAISEATETELARATIPVENIDGPVLVVSGGADEAWPSTELAGRVVGRLERQDHEWPVEHRAFPDAGHAIRVPDGDSADDSADDGPSTATHWLGGTHEANARAATEAWEATLEILDWLERD